MRRALGGLSLGLHCGEAGVLIVRSLSLSRAGASRQQLSLLSLWLPGRRTAPAPADQGGGRCEALAEAVALDARSERLGVLYRNDAVAPATAARVALRLFALAEACARHPDAPLSSLAWLPAGESKVLDAFNTPASAPCRGLIHEQIRRKAAAFPARRAVEVLASGADLDYRGLLREADALAATLAGVVGAARRGPRAGRGRSSKDAGDGSFFARRAGPRGRVRAAGPLLAATAEGFVAADADAAALVVLSLSLSSPSGDRSWRLSSARDRCRPSQHRPSRRSPRRSPTSSTPPAENQRAS